MNDVIECTKSTKLIKKKYCLNLFTWQIFFVMASQFSTVRH